MATTIYEALSMGKRLLEKANIDSPSIDAAVILCHVLNCDRTFLYAHGSDILEDEASLKYAQLLEMRVRGVPVQYITGRREFMSLEFEVNPFVLIPRQETELLAETVLELARSVYATEKEPLSILDVGTGSGCIAVSIAYYLENCKVTAVDISEGALQIAGLNAAKHKVSDKIALIKSDLFENIPGKRFDIIVSNPPYIRRDEIKGLMPEVAEHEPAEALDGGIDGLDFYRRLIKDSPAYIKRGGTLAMEVGIGQARAVAGMMKISFEQVAVKKDIAGIDRVVMGIKP